MSGSQTLQNLTYNFNAATGNLTSRYNAVNGLTENFTYDNLHRLTNFGGKAVTYDNNGNIVTKGDIGSFVYDTSGKPYAVSEVRLNNYSISVGTQDVSHCSFDRPSTITGNGYTANFTYNGNCDRVKMQMLHDNSTTLTRYYLGGCYELDIKPSGTTEKLYLGGDYYDAPVVMIKQGSSSSFYNILRDHLGSITHVVVGSGTVKQRLSYDAWGRLRNPSTNTLYTPSNEPELFLGRGYCGHEHLTGLGLINMNARLYDPLLGRFLSPDPYVQAPDHSQSFNRYSYCMNNPLKYVDEDGEFWWIIAAAVVGGVINVVSNHGNIHSLGDALGYFGVGAVAGGVGALTGGIGFGVGGALGGALSGLVSGASAGFLLGGGNALVAGNYNGFWNAALTGMAWGAGTGAILGAGIGAYSAWRNGENILTGPNESSISQVRHRPQSTEPDAMSNKAPMDYDMGECASPAITSNETLITSDPQELIHYTSKENYIKIMESKELKPSVGIKHARYGNGQYFTDLDPSQYTAGQISRRLYGVPWNTSKLEYFIKIDVRGLNIIQNSPHNFLLPGNNILNLQNKVIESGVTVFKINF